MKKYIPILLLVVLILCLSFQTALIISDLWQDLSYGFADHSQAEMLVMNFAQENGLRYSDYPESLIALLDRNPETLTFVTEYPLKKDQDQTVNLSGYSRDTVPLFMQWDQQWGYIPYGSDVAGLTACGPVCLSMAAYYLTGDPAMSPDRIIEFSIQNGYCVPGNGTSWTLISKGGEKLGLKVTELPLNEWIMKSYLQDGYPIICVMGPGDFTTSGHYIVLAGVRDGAFVVNDPNSYANSAKLWTYEEIQNQIRNLWVLQPGLKGVS